MSKIPGWLPSTGSDSGKQIPLTHDSRSTTRSHPLIPLVVSSFHCQPASSWRSSLPLPSMGRTYTLVPTFPYTLIPTNSGIRFEILQVTSLRFPSFGLRSQPGIHFTDSPYVLVGENASFSNMCSKEIFALNTSYTCLMLV